MVRASGKSANMESASGGRVRKLHLGVDEATREILAAVVTTNDVADSSVLPQLLDGIDEETLASVG